MVLDVQMCILSKKGVDERGLQVFGSIWGMREMESWLSLFFVRVGEVTDQSREFMCFRLYIFVCLDQVLGNIIYQVLIV